MGLSWQSATSSVPEDLLPFLFPALASAAVAASVAMLTRLAVRVPAVRRAGSALGLARTRPAARAVDSKPSTRGRVPRSMSTARDAAQSGAMSSQAEIEAYQAQQKKTEKLPAEVEARTIVACGKSWGVLSTIGKDGCPGGSVVEYATTDAGLPIFAFSTLSSHTHEIQENPLCSLTVTAPGFSDMSGARVTLQGRCSVAADQVACERLYMDQHPGSFWASFGDFSFFEMTEVSRVRFNGGFGRAKNFTGAQFASAEPDPVFKFSAPICGHMNDDHGADVLMYVKHYAGLTARRAEMRSIDALGMDVKAWVALPSGGEDEAAGEPMELDVRLNFSEPARTRMQVKDRVVEMSRKARSEGA